MARTRPGGQGGKEDDDDERLERLTSRRRNVEFFEEEPLKIKYFDPSRNKNRHYIPDFLVEYDCGIKEIWEVKPSYLVKNDETTKAKVKAANKFLEENSDIHNGFIITEKEIEMMKTYDFVERQ